MKVWASQVFAVWGR